MKALNRIRIGRGEGGEPLPTVIPDLERRGARPRRGQVSMIAGPPASFKSGVAQCYVGRLAQRGVRVLYVSADTDEHDTKLRFLAMFSGERAKDIESNLLDSDPEASAYYTESYDELLGKVPSLMFDFETDPTYDHLAEVVLAYNEMWGDYPEVVVIDNLMNVASFNENEWQGMKEVSKDVKRLGRLTGAAVLVLHHVNEGKNPLYPAPRKDVAGKVNQLPELILSIACDPAERVIRLAVVKNRSGPADPTGESWFELFADADRMALASSRYGLENGILL